MEWWTTLLLLFSGMVLLLLTGLPVAFSFLIVNMVAAYFFLGGIPGLIATTAGIFNSITTFTLLPVPFFIFMGELIFHSGLGLQAINVLDKWLGRLPGRLSLMAVITGVVFAALSGSTIANTALLGTVLLPEMRQKGYSKTMSLGPIMGVGGVAMLIPQCFGSGANEPGEDRRGQAADCWHRTRGLDGAVVHDLHSGRMPHKATARPGLRRA